MKKQRWVNVLFLFPTVAAFVLVIIIPFFLGIFYSLTDWDGVRSTFNFVGLKNFQGMFQSPDFIHSFLMTVLFTVINVVSVNVISFLLSLLVTSKLRLRNLYRAGFFVPNLIGGIVLGYIWQFIFNFGLTTVGRSLGIGWLSTSWIGNANTVIWAMSLVNTWQYAGYIMMIYVASIQSIPASLMEAANVDGANYITRIRKILMPMMANAFTISLFLTLTNSFKQYDMNVTLTNGGPAKLFMGKAIKASELLAMNIYNTGVVNNRMAEGQARAVIFFIVLVVVSLVQVTLNKRKEVEM